MKTHGMWTVVQHSAMGVKGDTTFAWGLETREVDTKMKQNRVEKAGGVLFGSYTSAEDFCESASYPANYEGLIPQAAGTFSDVMIDGLKVYIPVRVITG